MPIWNLISERLFTHAVPVNYNNKTQTLISSRCYMLLNLSKLFNSVLKLLNLINALQRNFLTQEESQHQSGSQKGRKKRFPQFQSIIEKEAFVSYSVLGRSICSQLKEHLSLESVLLFFLQKGNKETNHCLTNTFVLRLPNTVKFSGDSISLGKFTISRADLF